MVTGYLMNKKVVGKKYYFNIIIPILTYLYISFLCLLIRKYVLCDQKDIKDLLLGIFTFETNAYSWYVNMYIGLYLIIPFLNMIIEKIKINKNLFFYFICILTLITSIPKFLNYWAILYLINYYFIGAYIKEYHINIKKCKCFIFIIIIIFAEVLISKRIGFNTSFFNNYGMILILMKSVLLFLLLNSIKLKKDISILKEISNHTLSIYLISYVIDTIIYSFFNNIFLTYEQRFFHLYIILIIFAISFILALTIDWVVNCTINKIEVIFRL